MKQVSIKLDAVMELFLDDLAEKQKRSHAQIVRMMIEKEMEKADKNGKDKN